MTRMTRVLLTKIGDNLGGGRGIMVLFANDYHATNLLKEYYIQINIFTGT